MPFDEEQVQRSLARVCTPDGGTLGTAFFVLGPDAVALTCHHLVESRDTVLLECGDGRTRRGTLTAADRFPEVDVAVIRCAGEPPPPGVLPLTAETVNVKEYWSKGFHHYGLDVNKALPVRGSISGTTDIRFSTPGGGQYLLGGVLLLKDDLIDPGLSGAPVLDPESGVAFAMVNAKFTREGPPAGFGLPFARAKTLDKRLAELFAENCATVPSYGRLMNYLGAREICRRQRAGVFGRPAGRKLFLDRLYCERQAERFVSDFFAADSLILPIIGNAGVGKSTLLAELARREDGQEFVLLLARDLRSDESDLSAAVTAALRRAAPELITSHADSSTVAAALRREGRRLTVILDGLNETPGALMGSFGSWLERSIEWVIQSGARLIVSSRPEFWEVWRHQIPEDVIFGVDNREQGGRRARGVHLGDFTEAEAEKVKELYGLRDDLPARDVQHPLMAYVYWAMRGEGRGGPVSMTRYGALRRFIDLKCAKIAQTLAPGVLSTTVEGALKSAARAAITRGGFEMDEAGFDSLSRQHPRMGDELLQEGLLARTNTGARFTFDEIAEFLQGLVISVDTVVEWASSESVRRRITAGAAVYATLRLEAEGRERQVGDVMKALADARTGKGYECIALENAFTLLLQNLSRTDRFLPQIELMGRQMTAPEMERYDDYFALRRVVAGADLPLGFKFDFLKNFLTKEDSYDFEPHHWDGLDRYVFSQEEHTATIMATLIRADPLAAFGHLIGWLRDKTFLRDGKSRVSDAARAVMFYFRRLAFGDLCEMLARPNASYAAVLLLSKFAADEPRETLAVCEGWAAGEEPELLYRAAHLSLEIAHHHAGVEFEDSLYRVLSGILAKSSGETALIAKKGMAYLVKYRDAVIHDLLSLFKQGSPEVSGYTVADWAGTHFKEVADAVEDLLSSGRDPERAIEALRALFRRKHGDEDKERLLSLMELGAEASPILYSFGTALEAALYAVDSEVGRRRLSALVRRLVGASSAEARRPLIYFATSFPLENNEHQNALAEDVLELLAEHETDRDNLSLLIEKLAGANKNPARCLELLRKVSRHMSADEFHLKLVGTASGEPGFAASLVEWLDCGEVISPTGPTQAFLNKVRGGREPKEAAREVLWEHL